MPTFSQSYTFDTMAKVTLPVRIEPEDIARLDKIAAVMSERAGVPPMRRSDAARAVLLTGMAAHEARLGIVTAKKGSKPGRSPAK